MINDFSIFPSEDKEGPSCSYWYHEDTQSYFDDFHQYQVIKSMCRPSCSLCGNVEDNNNNMFHDIDQLKDHLFDQHRLFMCNLCLEDRKVFICEQKLYSTVQLEQHINTGDCEVDGTECQRGGFKGHPLCEFCGSPFYGDDEIYVHMETEHYHCFICKRQNLGQYEYYMNYDDLESHFQQEHFLCKNEACLSKKFIVFSSENEIKRHDALEHGVRMQRAKRNAVLQLPTNFTCPRNNEQDDQHDSSEADEVFQEIEDSLEATANVNPSFLEASSSSNALNYTNINDMEPLIQPFESLATDSDPPSGYLMAVSQRPTNAFRAPSGRAQKPTEGLPRNPMPENLRRQNHRPPENEVTMHSLNGYRVTNRGISMVETPRARK